MKFTIPTHVFHGFKPNGNQGKIGLVFSVSTQLQQDWISLLLGPLFVPGGGGGGGEGGYGKSLPIIHRVRCYTNV